MAAVRAIVRGGALRLPQCASSVVVKGYQRSALSSTASLCLKVAPLRQSFVQGPIVQTRKYQGCRVVSAEYSVVEEGAAGSLEYRVFFSDKSGKTVSITLARVRVFGFSPLKLVYDLARSIALCNLQV